MFGLLSAFFANYRLLSIDIFPLHTILYRVFIHLFIGVIAWTVFGVNKKVIRFFSSKDYLNLIFILFLIHIASITSGLLLDKKHQLKPELFLISFFITCSYIIVSRFIISYLYFYYRKSKKVGNQKKLLIYGAGELGVFIKKSIYSQYQDDFDVVAFLDDDTNKIGRFIGGLKVINASSAELKNVITKHQVTDIIIANKSITKKRKSTFLEDTLPFNIKIREISSIDSLFNSNFNLDKLSTIDINDLMNREPIELFDKHVVESLKDKTVLVTGAAGSIGSEIVRKLSEHNASLIVCVDFSESALYDLEQELKRKHPNLSYKFILTDIRNEQLMSNVFQQYAPNFIYHAAAYKHVPLMEQYPWEAIQTNVFGTWSIVKQAIRYKVEKFVFISSDKAVNPTSVMGATKKLAEIIVQAFSSTKSETCFVVTRFGNVLGSNGSVVPLFKKQIQAGGPVTVTHPEMIRYFMTIAEACQLVLEASVMASGGEVFVFDMGEPVKIVDLAKNMIRLAGFTPNVDIKIEFIGERPGEKLYEEVFSKNETMKETHHEKILISKENIVQLSEAENIIEKLKSLKGFYEPELYKIVIKDLLPEFKTTEGNSKVINLNANKKSTQYI
jgi:FlaA1/EpsC-like NDP-sugar epimerase